MEFNFCGSKSSETEGRMNKSGDVKSNIQDYFIGEEQTYATLIG